MRQTTRSTPPVAFLVLALPWGMSGGFITLTLPFALTEAGFSVAATASIVALGASANVWRFLWGPLADLTLTLHRWYALGISAAALTLLPLGFMPLRDNALLPLVVLLSQVAATFVVLPLGGLMAHSVADAEKGRASGWYQAGNLGGGGLGGGLGIWLTDTFSLAVAAVTLASVMMICLAALRFAPAVSGPRDGSIGGKLRELARDFRDMLRSPAVLLAIALVTAPIGIGAASYLWSAVAPGWGATANTVALVTGFLGALVSAASCVLGGWMADRYGRWSAFFGAGVVMAAVALVMAASPRTPDAYAVGVLFYAFSLGLASAAYSAVVIHAVGGSAASAKYAILSSFGNLPLVCMTAFDGWMYERWGPEGMLTGEALLALVCIAIGMAAVWRFSAAHAPIPESAGS
jgi:MFS transporter, PAT family, beta-lactamase induction signal transducer AmpG